VADVKAKLFASDGSAKGDIGLDADIFGIEPNLAVLHQVVTAQLAARRRGSASTKTRAEVRGGGRKPWRQKGLGRARQGSIRAPHWVGGGVAHGPKPRDYTQRTPKKMKKLALRSALSARASEDAVLVVEDLDWAAPKTKQAVGLLGAMGASGKTLLVISSIDSTAGRSFRNLPEVRLAEPGQITPYDVLGSDQVVFTSHTVGSVGKASSYEISEEDFIKDDASSSGRGNDFASGEDRAEDFVKDEATSGTDSDDGGES
jgi:large subunit ribosomal protein L4